MLICEHRIVVPFQRLVIDDVLHSMLIFYFIICFIFSTSLFFLGFYSPNWMEFLSIWNVKTFNSDSGSGSGSTEQQYWQLTTIFYASLPIITIIYWKRIHFRIHGPRNTCMKWMIKTTLRVVFCFWVVGTVHHDIWKNETAI